LQLSVSFDDVPDIGLFPVQPASGPLVLPRARDIRLIFSAAAAPDPQLQYWGSDDAMIGQTVELLTGAYGSDETGIFTPDIEANLIRGIMLQADPVMTSNLAAVLALQGRSGTATSDIAGRLAEALSLNVSGLTLSGQSGERLVFGCSSALRHSLSPEHGAITFAAKTELYQHWLVVITLQLARDWSWGALGAVSFEVRNTANQVVGTIDLTQSVGMTALADPDRSSTTLIFFDAVDPKPAAGSFPSELNLSYQVKAVFNAPPAQQDPPLQLPLLLPIAARPLQSPQLASAGIALSPYAPAPDYSATTVRQRALWLEFTQPIADPDDTYFGRVLSYAPDQMLTGAPFADVGVDPLAEPPLPVDPELIRTIVPGQSDDHAGLGAMQQLVPSSSAVHYMLPLPPGLAVDAPELFGMFTYELRVGHTKNWSTAQGRFGPPLRVAGVQHPAPPLLALVNSTTANVSVSAPYAMPTFNGRNLLPSAPRTQLWALLYAQVTQADVRAQRNVLLARQRLTHDREGPLKRLGDVRGIAAMYWQRAEIDAILTSLALPTQSPLSVIVVETFHNIGDLADPLGGDLGRVRILRLSPLTAVPAVC
jgi:hypothetical protein